MLANWVSLFVARVTGVALDVPSFGSLSSWRVAGVAVWMLTRYSSK